MPAGTPSLRRGNRTRSWGPERGPGRRTHYAARMSEDVPRTVPVYSRSLSVDAPTKEILAKHGLDDSCPPELRIRFQVYKKVVVSAGLITPEGEESTVLSAHVALALLRDIPHIQSHETSRLIDPEKTLAFHNDSEPREESGIGIEPGPQELDSPADEGSDDASAAPVRVRGRSTRAEIEALLTHVSSAKTIKNLKIIKVFRQWAGVRGSAASRTVHGGTDESADEIAPETVPVASPSLPRPKANGRRRRRRQKVRRRRTWWTRT